MRKNNPPSVWFSTFEPDEECFELAQHGFKLGRLARIARHGQLVFYRSDTGFQLLKAREIVVGVLVHTLCPVRSPVIQFAVVV
jgi:hypothetical protein